MGRPHRLYHKQNFSSRCPPGTKAYLGSHIRNRRYADTLARMTLNDKYCVFGTSS